MHLEMLLLLMKILGSYSSYDAARPISQGIRGWLHSGYRQVLWYEAEDRITWGNSAMRWKPVRLHLQKPAATTCLLLASRLHARAGLACWLLATRLSVLTEPAQGLFCSGPLHGYSRTAESVPKTSLASVNATAQP